MAMKRHPPPRGSGQPPSPEPASSGRIPDDLQIRGSIHAGEKLLDFNRRVWSLARQRATCNGLGFSIRLSPSGSLQDSGRFGGKLWLLRCLRGDRKSTRLNSSHLVISYAVFCLKKKKKY